MRQFTTPAIILRRTNYDEADKIVTFLTPLGKVKAIVKGVRRSKSKLAGGVELFSRSEVTFLQTRGDLQRVVSARLLTHWADIIGDLPRMMFGYEAMKLTDRIVEDEAEAGYFDLLNQTLAGLDNLSVGLGLVQSWFFLRLLNLTGHQLKLDSDSQGTIFREDQLYCFVLEEMGFQALAKGDIRPEQIKLLKLCLQQPLERLATIKNVDDLAKPLQGLLNQAAQAVY